MRAKSWWAVAGASVVVVAFASAQQTGALWKTSTPVSGETMTAGTTILHVGTGSNLIKDYTMTGFGGTALASGSVVQRPLTIKNDGSSHLTFILQSTTVTTTPATSTPMSLNVWTVANEGACPAVGTPTGTSIVSNAALPGAATSTPITLVPAGTTTWCMAVTMGATPQISTSSKIKFTFQATQVAAP